MATPSAKLVAFAAGVNSGKSGYEAAVSAGYAESTARVMTATLLERARTAGLVLTIAEATAPLDAIRAAVKPEDWTAIAQRALDDAKGGDRAARQWLSDYLIGKPSQPVEHAGKLEFVFRYSGDPADDEDDDSDD